jgi:GT2 family glycosyltransferase
MFLDTCVGIVIPTLGRRQDYLRLCVESIRAAGHVHLCIVAPEESGLRSLVAEGVVDQFVVDPGNGLADAINRGIKSMPEKIKFANWLGDDDLLEPGSIELTRSYLEEEKSSVMVFGRCSYIDSSGKLIFENRSGQWAVALMHFGPQMVSQPGALFRRGVFEELNGLDVNYKWAFDLEFFLRLSKIGKLSYVPFRVSSFRWHSGSLSVGGRRGSVEEASSIRKKFLPAPLRKISEIWEAPIRFLILRAGERVSNL